MMESEVRYKSVGKHRVSKVEVTMRRIFTDGTYEEEKMEGEGYVGFLGLSDGKRMASMSGGKLGAITKMILEIPDMLLQVAKEIVGALDSQDLKEMVGELDKKIEKAHACRSCGDCHHD